MPPLVTTENRIELLKLLILEIILQVILPFLVGPNNLVDGAQSHVHDPIYGRQTKKFKDTRGHRIGSHHRIVVTNDDVP